MYLFGGNTGVASPDELERRRAAVEALRLASLRPASNVGEGLGVLGAALGARIHDGRLKKSEAAGRESANLAMNPIIAALGGGQFPAAPGASAGPQAYSSNPPVPMDYGVAQDGGNMPAYANDRVARGFGQVPMAGEQPQAGPMAAMNPAPGTAAPSGNWLQYANTGATRNLPLNDELTKAMGFLPELGVTMEVFSGGQAGKGEGGPRVGSTRHDHGNAADVFFYKDGRKLNWANEADRPIFEEIVRRGKAAGVTGFGAGPGYMREGSMHLGFGDAAVWGRGGSGANAPDWLRAAYNSPANAASGVAAINSAAPGQQGQPVQMAQAAPQGAPMSDALPEMAGNNPNRIALAQLLQTAQNQHLNPTQRGILDLLLKRELTPPDAPEPFTLGEGQVRFDGNGNPIAKGGEKRVDEPSAVREYQFAVSQGFQGTFQDWESSKKGGMSLQVDPTTGQVTFQQGNIKPLTESQSKDTVYATRAEGALGLLDEHGDALTNLGESVAGRVPVVGNYLKSPEYQRAQQAGNEFLQAILRKDTGAAITSQEMDEYGKTYLPMPGDSAEVLAQKKLSRRRALEAIKAGMPAQAILSQENALRKTGAPKSDRVNKPLTDMTDEELEAIANGDR